MPFLDFSSAVNTISSMKLIDLLLTSAKPGSWLLIPERMTSHHTSSTSVEPKWSRWTESWSLESPSERTYLLNFLPSCKRYKKYPLPYHLTAEWIHSSGCETQLFHLLHSILWIDCFAFSVNVALNALFFLTNLPCTLCYHRHFGCAWLYSLNKVEANLALMSSCLQPVWSPDSSCWLYCSDMSVFQGFSNCVKVQIVIRDRQKGYNYENKSVVNCTYPVGWIGLVYVLMVIPFFSSTIHFSLMTFLNYI